MIKIYPTNAGQATAMVHQLEKELEYYMKMAEEQTEIIEQLTGTGKPKGYVYMHPADVSQLLYAAIRREDYFQTSEKQNPNERNINGRIIRASTHIPALTKLGN